MKENYKMKLQTTSIVLQGLRFYARHGVDPQETAVGAQFTIDLKIETDFSRALETDELEGSWWENPENIIIDQESTRSLEQEIHRTLSPMENKVLEYYLKGYGYIQIAKIMGKTPKSIDNALQRIRGKIRNFSLSFWDKK